MSFPGCEIPPGGCAARERRDCDLMKLVVDASVALKWQFEEEEESQPAIALLQDFAEGKVDLITLTLFSSEILSAINVAITRGRISETAGQKALIYLTSLGIQEESSSGLIEGAFKIARKYGLSAYDSAYIALGEKERCDFYTGEKRFFHAAQRDLPRVKWIGNYS